jgi:hypothetical protein
VRRNGEDPARTPFVLACESAGEAVKGAESVIGPDFAAMLAYKEATSQSARRGRGRADHSDRAAPVAGPCARQRVWRGRDCGDLFNPVGTRLFTSPRHLARSFLARSSVKYTTTYGPAGSGVKVLVNGKELPYTDAKASKGQAIASAAERSAADLFALPGARRDQNGIAL